MTDGLDTDGDRVRCDKGYYTRSGYVAGELCRYSWDKVWNEVKNKNKQPVDVSLYYSPFLSYLQYAGQPKR